MALYKGATHRASPLRIQLTAPSTAAVYVVSYSAFGENSAGASSRPILTRPSVPGQGSGVAIPMRFPGPENGRRDPIAQATLITLFKNAPSVPRVNVGSYLLPISVQWSAPRGQEVVVGHGESILLYALTNGDHTWSGEIQWEEK